MWRSYLAAALRRLGRDRLHAGVTIFTLALGFTAAILITVFIRDEQTYEHVFPDHARIYDVNRLEIEDGSKTLLDGAGANAAGLVKAHFPGVEDVTRLDHEAVMLGRGQTSALHDLAWVDGNFFAVFPLRRLRGEGLNTALARPDDIVITRSLARDYFGDADPVGKTLDLNHAAHSATHPEYSKAYPMLVTAVVEDLPSETHLKAQAFASAQTPLSPLHDAWGSDQVHNYFRVPRGSAGKALAAKIRRELPKLPFALSYDVRTAGVGAEADGPAAGDPTQRRFYVQAIDDEHLLKDVIRDQLDSTADTDGMNAPSYVVAFLLPVLWGLAGLIVFIAALNFVTLMTARAAQRGVEIGVRKAVGARRHDLVVQFTAEVVFYAALALVLAMAAAELILPVLNSLFHRTVRLDYLNDPGLLAIVVGGALVTGVGAGLYPALILSRVRPVPALKAAARFGRGAVLVRQGLVVAQFAVLIGLCLTAIAFYRQSEDAVARVMKPAGDPVVIVQEDCSPEALQRFGALQGVRAIICGAGYQDSNYGGDEVQAPGGRWLKANVQPEAYGATAFLGHRLLAGRLFADLPREAANNRADPRSPAALAEVVINETARRALGFATPQAALGGSIVWREETKTLHVSAIVGVRGDYAGRFKPGPTLALAETAPDQYGIEIKIARSDLAATLRRLDAAWTAMGELKPMRRTFLDDQIRADIQDVIVIGEVTAAAAGVAVIVAALGMFALSAFSAEQRTKEIGIRKAMGARTGDVLGLLLWQFVRPVIVAIALACPLAWLGLSWWQKSFAAPVPLSPWVFGAVAAGALILAWLTVLAHALAVARAKPVAALRYE